MNDTFLSSKIRKITTADTFAVRHPVLRQGKPLESCRFDGDELDTTQHFGYYDNSALLGVISLFLQSNPQFNFAKQHQIRGMAVLDSHRKKGIGAALVKHVETVAASKSTEIIWFNAREIAVPFYQNLGYKVSGEAFTIGDIGIHYRMFKRFG
ncbi:MAG TPA: GNAT family N-acetyltransferase [Flavobacterium sp.]